jgi:hypothetical protein
MRQESDAEDSAQRAAADRAHVNPAGDGSDYARDPRHARVQDDADTGVGENRSTDYSSLGCHVALPTAPTGSLSPGPYLPHRAALRLRTPHYVRIRATRLQSAQTDAAPPIRCAVPSSESDPAASRLAARIARNVFFCSHWNRKRQGQVQNFHGL